VHTQFSPPPPPTITPSGLFKLGDKGDGECIVCLGVPLGDLLILPFQVVLESNLEPSFMILKADTSATRDSFLDEAEIVVIIKENRNKER
jgi:hypothetical protein